MTQQDTDEVSFLSLTTHLYDQDTNISLHLVNPFLNEL